MNFKNIKLLFFVFSMTSIAQAETTTTRLPPIGAAPKEERPIRAAYPHMSLASCSQAIAKATFNPLPVKIRARGSYSLNINLRDENQHKGRTYLFLGDASSPRLALLTKDRILLKDLKAGAWNDPERQGETKIVNIFRFESEIDPPFHGGEGRFGDTHFANVVEYPGEIYGYFSVNPRSLNAHDLPMDVRVDILSKDELTSPSEIESTKAEIQTTLRDAMDKFVDAMVFKARERVGLETRTQWHRPTHDIDYLDFYHVKNAFCTCKDMAGFEGFEQESLQKLFGRGGEKPSFGSFLITTPYDENNPDQPKARPLRQSDLNCNLS